MTGSVPKPELLAPAGSREALTAAVKNGADAVYFGTREFNARIFAKNFSIEELGDVVTYCHKNGVRVYLTMNTLVKNHELKRFFNVMSRIYTAGADGVIIQHVSFLEIIKKNFPGLAVFISTQGAIGNLASASLLKSADRIILARELPLEEVKKIINAGTNVEVFVHGALCFSFSGLCLFSSFVSSRSGNRGSCAQQCRQRYNDCYPLSTRELCLVRRIPELVEAGISGFKIEGRMRSPLYVGVATRLYRKAIDSYRKGKFVLPGRELSEIEVVFNREFTEGFLFGDREILSPEKPMNRGAFLGAIKDNEIELERDIAVGDGVGIWVGEDIRGAVIHEIHVNGRKVASAGKGERADIGVKARDGTRVYLTSSAKITVEPDFTPKRIPVTLPARNKVTVSLPEFKAKESPNVKFMVKAYSTKEVKESFDAGADIVFYNIFSPDFPDTANFKGKGILGAYLPRIMDDEELSQVVKLLHEKKSGAILSGNLGFLARRDEFSVPVYLDYTLNAFNDVDLEFFERYKAVPVLSPELCLNEMVSLKNKDTVVLCHGDVVLVNTRIEIKDGKLTDEKGFSFPVRKEGSYWQILNSRPFGMFSDIKKLKDAGFKQFLIDQQGKSATFVSLYRKMLTGDVASRRLRKGYTAGHLYRPVD